MDRRFSILAIVGIFFIGACRPTSMEQFSPTATGTPRATSTSVTPTETPIRATETAIPPSALTSNWFSQLEVIRALNWAHVQLLKTIPAEMPLNHSAVAISPDGKKLAIGSSSGARILFLDLASGDSSWVDVQGVSNADAYFNKMEYLLDGTLIANADGPYMIYHIDGAGMVLSAWEGIAFAVSADREIIAHTDQGIVLVQIANNTPLVFLKDGSGFDFSFSPDGSKLAAEDVGVDSIHTVIWDIPSQTILTTLDETAAPRFSPDGTYLAAIRYDSEHDRTPLKIFTPDGAVEIATLEVGEPDDLINRAPVLGADGSVVVAQVTNGSSIAWDAASWQLLKTPILQGLVESLSLDGRILITRADDGAILLWGVLP